MERLIRRQVTNQTVPKCSFLSFVGLFLVYSRWPGLVSGRLRRELYSYPTSRKGVTGRPPSLLVFLQFSTPFPCGCPPRIPSAILNLTLIVIDFGHTRPAHPNWSLSFGLYIHYRNVPTQDENAYVPRCSPPTFAGRGSISDGEGVHGPDVLRRLGFL